MSLDYLCIWQVQVSVYCTRRLRCTQCTILVYLINICFLPCLWQISQIQTCLCVVVGPGFVSTSSAFMSSASHPAGPHGRFSQKRSIGSILLWAGFLTQFVWHSARSAVTATPIVGCVDWSQRLGRSYSLQPC